MVVHSRTARYEYDGEEYVWPFVEEVRHEYVSVPEDHLAVMKVLLSEFSGICCLGYKLRKDGSICVLVAVVNLPNRAFPSHTKC